MTDKKQRWLYVTATGQMGTTVFRSGRHVLTQSDEQKLQLWKQVLDDSSLPIIQQFIKFTSLYQCLLLVLRYWIIMRDFSSLYTTKGKMEIVENTIQELQKGGLVKIGITDTEDLFRYASPHKLHALLGQLADEYPEAIKAFMDYLLQTRQTGWGKNQPVIEEWISDTTCAGCQTHLKQKKRPKLWKPDDAKQMVAHLQSAFDVLDSDPQEVFRTTVFCQICGQPYDLTVINEFQGMCLSVQINTERKRLWVPQQEGIRKLRLRR